MNKTIIICDIDGTIADHSHRKHYVEPKVPEGGDEGAKKPRKNWVAFHAGVAMDAVHHDVRTILVLLSAAPDMRVIYVSGRMERSRADTYVWLRENDFPEGDLHMRAENDFRSDDVVKEEIVDRLGLSPADVLCVLDDRDRVVAMWRRRGFRVLQVAGLDNHRPSYLLLLIHFESRHVLQNEV
ncbi:MAG TPA: hypothetical protein PLW14_08580 [Chlorobiota bacterium]|nr:hypothetical protein [Chlorobiota bacterium]